MLYHFKHLPLHCIGIYNLQMFLTIQKKRKQKKNNLKKKFYLQIQIQMDQLTFN